MATKKRKYTSAQIFRPEEFGFEETTENVQGMLRDFEQYIVDVGMVLIRQSDLMDSIHVSPHPNAEFAMIYCGPPLTIEEAKQKLFEFGVELDPPVKIELVRIEEQEVPSGT